ncbi:hypothetical protein ACWG0P_05695 [Amedibacillus sp. YH-ame6]
MNKTRNDIFRRNFIQALINFSSGKISEKEANSIADKKLRLTDFSDDSPLAHKGVRWLAKRIVHSMELC